MKKSQNNKLVNESRINKLAKKIQNNNPESRISKFEIVIHPILTLILFPKYRDNGRRMRDQRRYNREEATTIKITLNNATRKDVKEELVVGDGTIPEGFMV